MSNTVKILFLGTTGYIGGTILDVLLKHPKADQFEIISFVRSEEKAKKLEAIGLKAISGSLSVLQDAAANAAVVFNVASSDDLPLTEAILAGAKKHYASTKVPPILIHTSGSAIIADNAMGQFASEKVYDDSDSATLDAIPVQQFHRNVDIPIADAHKQGYVKAYVIAPPIIWGLATGRLVDAGLQNPITTGLLDISRFAITRGSFGIVGPAVNLWSTVEVNDLANLFLVVFNATAIEGKEIAGGSAYYFPSNGDIATKDWMTKAAQALHKYGALKSSEITEFTSEETKKWPVLTAFGINSRVSDSRTRSLGWKPVHAGSEYLDDIDREIKLMVTQKDDFGASWASFGQ